MAALLVVGSILAGAGGAARELEREVPDQLPGKPASEDAFARSPGTRLSLGSYQSIQVNVDGAGNNIVGDAANEPSIAVNPLNPANMVIGWRQFDTVASNFRQAGWAYTFDGGDRWTFPGKLTPGVFRSDPSLDVDGHGTFYYQSLKGNLRMDVFSSTDGGVTWSAPVTAWGGDKNWMAIDRTGGTGDGFIYGIWQRFGGACCGTSVFTRSVDGGALYQAPVPVPTWPTFGTMAVGPSGEVYATGIDGTFGQDPSHYVVATSTNAGNPQAIPSFTGGQVELGGSLVLGGGPNPGGLSGQPNVVVNWGPGPQRGDVYVIGAIQPGTIDLDPLDVYMIRSEDGARTWSAPQRVNDDASDANHQWMAQAAVAPNGRIDAVWNDTRGTEFFNLSQLYYAYSWNGGISWSINVPVSPRFDTSLGYPQQNKMGDYMGIVSDAAGADVAYTATFNGEQDVYYVRLFPDCDGNGISDLTDLESETALDCNANHVPDACESAPLCVAGAGTVSGGLTVERTGTDLLLHWDPSCAPDEDYAVYEGTLGSYGSLVPRVCSTGTSTSRSLTPAQGNTFYLVVPTFEGREGSYGELSSGAQRSAAQSGCLPQQIRSCAR